MKDKLNRKEKRDIYNKEQESRENFKKNPDNFKDLDLSIFYLLRNRFEKPDVWNRVCKLIWHEEDCIKNCTPWIYFVICEETSRVKIWYSENIDRRLEELQVWSPTKLKLELYVTWLTMYHEWKLHEKFKQYRIRWEWFEYHKDIQDFISSIRKNGKIA